jgi:hypothetical protein
MTAHCGGSSFPFVRHASGCARRSWITAGRSPAPPSAAAAVPGGCLSSAQPRGPSPTLGRAIGPAGAGWGLSAAAGKGEAGLDQLVLVGADNAVTSRDLRILVDQATKPVTSSDAGIVVRGRDGDLAVGCSLTEGPVPRATADRPAGSGPGRSGGAAPRSGAGAPGVRHPWTPHAGPAPSHSRADGA